MTTGRQTKEELLFITALHQVYLLQQTGALKAIRHLQLTAGMSQPQEMLMGMDIVMCFREHVILITDKMMKGEYLNIMGRPQDYPSTQTGLQKAIRRLHISV